MALLAVGSHLFSTIVSAILRTRRGRDIATFLVLGIATGSFLLYRTVSHAIDGEGLATAVTAHPITDWALLIPPVAAQQAMISAAAHDPITAFAALGSAVGGLLVLASLWRRILNWLLTTPEQRSLPAARARRTGIASGLWGVVPTLARKEFRFYTRDPRQRLVWTGTVIFIGIAVAGVITNVTGFFDIRGQTWAPLTAPILVLFVGLPIVLNLFGWERNAASYLFVLPAKPRQLLLGQEPGRGRCAQCRNHSIDPRYRVLHRAMAMGLAGFPAYGGRDWLTACARKPRLGAGSVEASPRRNRRLRPINRTGLPGDSQPGCFRFSRSGCSWCRRPRWSC